MAFANRIANREDLAQIVAIYNSTIPSRQVTAETEPVSVQSRVRWFEEHSPDFRPLWVVETEGRIAGWLSFSSFYGRPAYNRTAELSVYVHADFRKRGIASYLLTQALNQAPGLGIDTLLGFIFGHNLSSLALFEKFGFSRWGELPKVALLDGVERDLVIVGRRAR
jgi:phosphinothricin acetyltransferase